MALKQIHKWARRWAIWDVDATGLGGRPVGFYPGIHEYGHIKDGVQVRTSGHWCTISFKDFEQMYLLAKKARENDGTNKLATKDATQISRSDL